MWLSETPGLFLQSQVGKLNEIDRLTKQVENAAA